MARRIQDGSADRRTERWVRKIAEAKPGAGLAACGRKAQYPSRRVAAGEVRRLRRLGAGEMNPYRCRFCKKYHVGHPRLADLRQYGKPVFGYRVEETADGG